MKHCDDDGSDRRRGESGEMVNRCGHRVKPGIVADHRDLAVLDEQQAILDQTLGLCPMPDFVEVRECAAIAQVLRNRRVETQGGDQQKTLRRCDHIRCQADRRRQDEGHNTNPIQGKVASPAGHLALSHDIADDQQRAPDCESPPRNRSPHPRDEWQRWTRWPSALDVLGCVSTRFRTRSAVETSHCIRQQSPRGELGSLSILQRQVAAPSLRPAQDASDGEAASRDQDAPDDRQASEAIRPSSPARSDRCRGDRGRNGPQQVLPLARQPVVRTES